MLEQQTPHTSKRENSIRLRRYRAGDTEAVYEAVRESIVEISQYMTWCSLAYSRDDATLWVKTRAAAWKQKSEFSFLIADQTGHVLGACGFNRIDWLSGTANLGYWVRTSATGRGVCTAAVALLRKFAFEETNLFRLEILVDVENIASQRVAEKSGAVREGMLRKRLLSGGVHHDAVVYSILKSD